MQAINRTGTRPARTSVPTKITAPRIDSALKRKRLFTLLERALRSPMVWIDGPAGSGKTTLVASYLRARKRTVLWYQVDSGDATPAALFHFLGLAVQQAGRRTKRGLPKLKPEHLIDLPNFARTFFRELGARFDKPVTLVFDNLQEAGESGALYDVLRIAQEEVPADFRMILISRAEPAEAYARARVSRMLARVSWSDLRLRDDEAGALARLLGARRAEKADPAIVAQLCKRCEGWVAGLILLLEGAQASTSAAHSLRGGSVQTLFDYFAAEVFARRPERTRLFLLHSALLPNFTVDMAERLTRHPGLRGLLTELLRQHHFIEVREEQPLRYQYHPLFRAFLLTKVQESFSREEIQSLRRRAGEIAEQAGDTETAVQLYFEAEDSVAAARLVVKQAPSLAAAGRHVALSALLARLPETVTESDPWLLYWKGVCSFIVAAALTYDYYERAYGKFLERGDARGCYLCWMGIARSLLVSRRFRLLIPWLTELRTLRERFPAALDPDVEEHIVYAALAAHVYVDPSLASVDRWVTRAEHCVRNGKDIDLQVNTAGTLIFYYSLKGELVKAKSIAEQLVLLLPRDGVTDVARIYALANLTLHAYLALGDPATGRAAAQEAEQLLARRGLRAMYPYTMVQVVNAHAQDGDLAGAATKVERFREQMLIGGATDISTCDMAASYVAILKGDYDLAVRDASLALARAEQSGTPIPSALCRLYLARALIETRSYEEGRAQLDEVLAFAKSMDSQLLLFEQHMARAHLALSASDVDACVTELRAAMRCGAAHELRSCVTWDADLMSRLCAVALRHGIETDYVRTLIRHRQLQPPTNAGDQNDWPTRVKVYTLGRFSLLLEDVPHRPGGKVQKKPLELLRALIAAGGRSVSATRLADLLWPDADGDAAYGSLTMAIKRLRTLLREPRALRLAEGKLTLDPRYCWVDVWSFERAATVAMEAEPGAGRLAAIDTALALYKGRFLSEATDAAWVLPARERLRTRFIDLVALAGRSWEEAGDLRKAVECYRRALAIDDKAEDFYARLMQCHARLAEPANVAQVYERCCQALNVDARPSRKIERLYRELQAM